jgi:hypothetical protein
MKPPSLVCLILLIAVEVAPVEYTRAQTSPPVASRRSTNAHWMPLSRGQTVLDPQPIVPPPTT